LALFVQYVRAQKMPLFRGCYLVPLNDFDAANIGLFWIGQEKKWFYEKKTKRQPGKPTAL